MGLLVDKINSTVDKVKSKIYDYQYTHRTNPYGILLNPNTNEYLKRYFETQLNAAYNSTFCGIKIIECDKIEKDLILLIEDPENDY